MSVHVCTQPQVTLMMGQNEGVALPVELSWAKCNCIGGQESNKALMEPNYFCYGLRDSQLQFFNAAIFFVLRVYNSIFSVYLCLFATHVCCVVLNYPEPPQTQTLYGAQMSQELEKF